MEGVSETAFGPVGVGYSLLSTRPGPHGHLTGPHQSTGDPLSKARLSPRTTGPPFGPHPTSYKEALTPRDPSLGLGPHACFFSRSQAAAG